MPLSCCLIILNYNGMDFLERCLSSALEAARKVTTHCPVVCVDNVSTDGSIDYIKYNFPQVDLVLSKENDFLFSLNDVIKTRLEEVVIILNNDMHFDKNFVEPLLSHLEDQSVFAASSSILDWNGVEKTIGPRLGQIRSFWFYKWFDFTRQQTSFSLEACGGASAYRRSMFVELGGYDPLYRPGYFEDLDLSYRAWQRGWKTIYEPKSIVFHKISASMVKRYGNDRKTRIHSRNHIIFTVKNIGNINFLLTFLLLLPLRAIQNLVVGNHSIFWGVLDSTPRLPRAIFSRIANRNEALKNSTEEIFRILLKEEVKPS